MDAAAAVAAKVCVLEAELAATSPRIADLEARVSLLEAENARWWKAMPRGEVSGPLVEGLGGPKPKTVQAYGSFNEVGDGEEEGVAADAGNGRSGEKDGVPAVPTPRKRVVRAVTGGSKDGELQVGVSGAPPSRKRALLRRIDGDEKDDETEGRPAPTIRRSTRLAEKQSKKARVEPNDHEEREDGSGQDGGMGESKNDADCSEDSDSEQEMDYTLLKDVTLASNNRVRIRVRITRISHYMSKHQLTGIPRLDFVMLDEQGDMMAGQVPAWLAQLFLSRIKEDDVYYIHHFKVVHPSLPYRAVDHPCMAMFTRDTEISKDEHVPDSFPVYAYKISPYEVLRSRENNTALMSDAIGLMLEVSNVKTVTVNGAPRAVRNVYISDGRETAVVALWEAHANQFPAETLQQQMQQRPVVILFVAVTVKLCEGQLCLQGSKVCRWYPNAPIPEVLALQNSSAGVSHEARLVDTSPTQTQTGSCIAGLSSG
ncbi:hypothetical protein CFC21_034713 [Triticum aestivum]|uniref:Replication protein A 70 kDa DNA-binding subunit B/D first OB fold domain-containing protein n=3 Tax=Triticum TaxID=4564 RepID=A0A9R0REW9_TRITD|nr:uncharacterized protein LOC119271398 isoform X1 [Triticum dicoccoides]XP_044336902.1 uncharacterized protein LOC123058148 isoform X1 [Triticum aestivum]KAF7021824.1 hypothetical protein CFC21_034713 [Triticum aestivum]VAH59060.1 unnamed protein product [Triticum turgidum subsp. durum]